MTTGELLVEISRRDLKFRRNGQELVLSGVDEALDTAFLNELRIHKASLFQMIDSSEDSWWSPAILITPEMLPLVALRQEDIDRIVRTVPGGARNVQDIYPLAPLQEGMLFHYLMGGERDPYLGLTQISFDSRSSLDRYLQALQSVVNRHDILRTAVLWEGLPEPVQVVWRQALLRLEEIEFNPEAGDIAEQMNQRFEPRQARLDIDQAPLFRLYISHDAMEKRWLLVMLFHHLAGDNTSLARMIGEVNVYLSGQEASLPAPRPFRNLVAQTRLGTSREEHEAYFRKMLGDVDETTAPFNLLEVKGDGGDIEQAQVPLQNDLVRRLRGHARQLGVSTASVCHLAWARVVGKLSGRDDVVFGTVLSGRFQGSENSEHVMGPVINTLPLRLRVGTETVQRAVRSTHEALADLMRHEHASLALVQRCSAVPAPAPLFSALFNYRQAGGVGVPQEGPGQATQVWDGIRLLRSAEHTNYPLSLSVDDLDETLTLDAQAPKSIGPLRICAYMQTVLESLVEALETSPFKPVFQLEVLPECERQQVLYQWNDTRAQSLGDGCVHQLFEQQVDRTPDAVAVVCEDQCLSYGELNRRGNQLAHYLRQIGVGPDTCVALCLDRSFEMIVALLGVLKAGGAYMPLDSAFPPERLRFMLEDSHPLAVLTQTRMRDLLIKTETSLPLLDLDGAPEPWNQFPHTNPDSNSIGILPQHLAYVIYTSGSTGNPKGVTIEHRSLANLIGWHVKAFESQCGQYSSSLAGVAFDAAAWEIWPAICAGATIKLPPRADMFDPEARLAWWDEQKLDVSFLPTAVAEVAFTRKTTNAHLKTLLVGGDRLRFLPPRPLPFRLVNNYGPTETTVVATSGRVEIPTTVVSIGRPIDNMQIYILDKHGDPVPAGVAGAMYIAGAGVARGYLNQPELTAEKFLTDPFSDKPHARMYETGDLAKWLPDGNIEFLGRIDFQVKVRGFRIELGEIETRLAEHDAVREALVLAREDTKDDKRIVAYYTVNQELDAVTADQLRSHLMASLPGYMVPVAYVRLEAMPLTPNGKLDRKALPAPERGAFTTRGDERPVGSTESALATVWAEILKLDRVGRHDNFFELGGHSLLAVRVAARLRQVLGIDVEIRDLFANPVLHHLARKLESAAATDLPPILPAPRAQQQPLSFAQQRLWFLAQIEGVSKAYHIPIRLRLSGDLDKKALRRALDTIVVRHEVLRTRFVLADGEPVQEISPAETSVFSLLEHDLRERGGVEDELYSLAAEEYASPFDLVHGPLIRGRLVHVAEREHALLLTMHHIIFDGGSMGVFFKELNVLYDAFRQGKQHPLLDLKIQYAGYAVWQREWVKGKLLDQQLEYWKEALAGAPALLELPLDYPRPAHQDFAGAEAELVLEKELTAALKALSRRHGTTLFMTMLAAWALLLARLSGQREVVIGTPTANRSRSEIEGLIGFFVNTLALRVELADSLRVSELLEQVRSRVVDAQQHQDIPFEQVVEAMRPVRSLSHTPLYQAMFTFQHVTQGELELPGLDLKPLRFSSSVATNFDLTLSLQEVGEHIIGSVEFAVSLFKPSTIQRYLECFRTLLVAMVVGEDQQVSLLPMLPAGERELVVYGWNDTAVEYPRDLCIHELFERQVAVTPDAIALVYQDAVLSYGELNRQANRLANYLRDLGVKPDTRVAICAERSFEMVVALTAVLKAGGAYIPLDPSYPEERLKYMLQDGRPVTLLTQQHLQERFAEAGSCPVLGLTGSHLPWQSYPDVNPDHNAIGLTTGHLAYVIYTSGSTGNPKGVAIEHRSLANLIHWHVNAFELQCGRCTSSLAGVSFDAAAWEIWPALCAGATLKLPPQSDMFDAEARLTWWDEQKLDVSFLPTAMAEVAFTRETTNDHLRTLLVGGDRLRSLPRRRLPFHLVNNYGPTETAVVATSGRVDFEATAASIGRTIDNMQLYILDNHGEPVPIGVPGELYLAGAGVARGYLNRPHLTAECFVPNPFGKDSAARMYRTGDLGKWLEDGNIDFIGRNDFQVKIRGFRIELGEIEARLAACVGVREAVVLVREDVPGDTRLVAYYTAVDAFDFSAEMFRTSLSGVLPEYMVPSAYMRLAAWPLTSNGKLDRKSLQAPERDAFTTRGEEQPVGPTESALATAWAEILKLDRVSRHDNFFELGGHSLLAVRVAVRLRQVLGIEVAIRDLFAHPVLQDLARKLENAAATELPPILPAQSARQQPLSFAQQRLWFLAQIEGVSKAYHIPIGLRLTGDLDRVALKRAFDTIVVRHEALRTRFVLVDGEPVQEINPAATGLFHLREHDLRKRERVEDELYSLVGEEYAAPFDLVHGPLIRGRLVHLAEGEHALLLTMHHIIFDGWSMGVFFRELKVLYGAYRQGKENPLADLEIQYADYAVWQRDWIKGKLLDQQLEYWKEALSGAPALLELPMDYPRPAHQDFTGAEAVLVFDKGLSAALKALSRRHGTTLFMTMLAAWALLLARLSGQREVVIGTPAANRGRSEIEGLIGFFVNTLALRVEVSGSLRVSELLEQVRSRVVAAQQHQDIPFEQVVEVMRPMRSLAHTPLFQSMFTWQHMTKDKPGLPGLDLQPLEILPNAVTKFDLTLSLQEAGEHITGGVGYAASLFKPSTMQRYLKCFRTLLEAMVEGDDQRVSTLPILPPDEREPLLYAWNDTAVEYPRDFCIHELFELQVAASPDAIALVYEDAELSYGELNRQANRLANYLQDQGVKPDTRVAICAERSLEMVVALIAVLKAGGAYVPLDPNYPEERLKYMLQDSQPVALLTQQHLQERFAQAGPFSVLPLTGSHLPWQSYPDVNPDHDTVGLSAAHLAYVIYTSGSTGSPKGVSIEHRSAVNLISWARRSFSNEELSDTLFSTSLSFDLAVYEVFVPLSVGAKVTLVATALDLIRRPVDVALINTVPSAMNALVEANAISGTVRTVNLAGEPLQRALVERIFSTTNVGTVCNLYGPSETTTYSTWVAMRQREGFLPHIGRPIANTQVYILDADGEPVPIGVPGELYIAGAGVARGYLNRPHLTAERFGPDPFVNDGAARMYRTGDLGKWLEDGNIDFMGRNDFQVKIRGFRIELGEIEARLAACAGVRDAVVLAREDVLGDKRLVAYYTGENEVGSSAETLRASLSGVLPGYMVPTAYMRLDAMPLTPNGKLDRKALPALAGNGNALQGYEAPQGEMETRLAAHWSELLKVDRVGRNDDFFSLGGHSLLATRLISRLRSAFGVELSIRTLFEAPTVASLVQHLPLAQSARPPLRPCSRPARIPLSFAQKRLWLLEQLEEAGATYNLPSALRLEGALNKAALRQALADLLDRHEILRTVYWEDTEGPWQRVLEEQEIPEYFFEQEIAVEHLQATLQKSAGYCFNLRREIPLRVSLLRLGEQHHVLLLLLHHIATDGWSMAPMTRDLADAYGARCQGSAPNWTSLPVQYADYSLWQRQQVGEEKDEHSILSRQLQYWKEKLAGLPPEMALCHDRPRARVSSYRGEDVFFRLPASLHRQLLQLAREYRATLFMVLHAGLAVLLTRLGAGTDIVLGSPIAGRNDDALNEMIGFFVNTLVLRTDTSGNPSFGKLLSEVRENDLNAYAHQDLPFEHLVEVLNPTRALNRHPLFQVMLMLQNTPSAELALTGLKASPESAGTLPAKFDLTFNLSEDASGAEPGDIFGHINYAADLFERTTVEKLAERFDRVLRAVAENPGQSIAEIDILGREERRQLLDEWNDPEAEPGSDKGVHQMFEEQAEKTPDSVAVVCGDRSLTYGELNRRSNQVAHHLRKRGVTADTLVALDMKRSVEMILGILGILKAGAAYVPLDRAYPEERLNFMMEDAGIEILLSEATISGLMQEPGLERTHHPIHNPHPVHVPETMAYVLYTSGSTGRPKGVGIEHRSLTNYICWAREVYGQKQAPLDFALFSSISFDLTVTSVFVPLVSGGCVHVYGEKYENETVIQHVFEEGRCDTVKVTPSHLATLSLNEKGRLRQIIVGGEALESQLVRRLTQEVNGPVTVWNEYGPTEATVACVLHRCRVDTDVRTYMPIGRPGANAQIYILDESQMLVPAGIAGEIYIGGPGLARGYLNRADLTAERFIPNAFGKYGGTRLYRTGDIGRWMVSGSIEYLGRNDHQVKLRGFRIELGEIERCLLGLNGVRAALVIAREDVPGQRRLVAYLAMENDSSGSLGRGEERVSGIREELRRTLPDYMVPSSVVLLPQLPLTPNGKLNRDALPVPEFISVSRRAPGNLQEDVLAFLFAEVLCLKQVGIDDDFFDLGGHSLLALRLAHRIRSTFAVELPVRTLYEASTVANLAQVLARMDDGSQGSFIPDRTPRLLDQEEGPDSTDTVPLVLRLQGHLEVSALQKVFIDLIFSNEILHTMFHRTCNGDGVPGFFSLEQISEDNLSLAMREALPNRFHAQQGPRLYASLFQLDQQQHVLMVAVPRAAIHHPLAAPLISGVIAKYSADHPRDDLNWAPVPIPTANFSALVS